MDIHGLFREIAFAHRARMGQPWALLLVTCERRAAVATVTSTRDAGRCLVNAPTLGRAAGIDGQHRAGDVLGLVAEQELDRIGHVIYVGERPQRAAARHLAALL